MNAGQGYTLHHNKTKMKSVPRAKFVKISFKLFYLFIHSYTFIYSLILHLAVQVSDGNGLDVLVLSHTVLASLATETTLLDSAKRSLGSAHQTSVDTHHTALELASDTHDATNILAEEVPREAELGRVGELDGLALGGEGEDGGEGAKGLVGGDLHLGGGAADDGGFVEEALAVGGGLAAGVEDAALGEGVGDVLGDLGDGAGVDEGALGGALVDAAAELEGVDAGDELLDESVLDLLVDQETVGALRNNILVSLCDS